MDEGRCTRPQSKQKSNTRLPVGKHFSLIPLQLLAKVQPSEDKVVGPCDLFQSILPSADRQRQSLTVISTEIKAKGLSYSQIIRSPSSSLFPSSTEGENGRVLGSHQIETSKKCKRYRKRRGSNKFLPVSSSSGEEGPSNRKRSKPKLRSRWSLKVQNIRKQAEAARKNLDSGKNVDAPKVFNYQGRLISEGEFKQLLPAERFVVDYIKQAYFYDGKLAFVTFWKYYPENHKERSSQEWGTNLRNYRNGVEAVEEFFKVPGSCRQHFKSHWDTLKENDFKIFGRRPKEGKQPPGPNTVQAVINLEESEEENDTAISNIIGMSAQTINIGTNIAGANKIIVKGFIGKVTSDQKPIIVKCEIKQENFLDDSEIKISPNPIEMYDDYCEIVEVKLPQPKRSRSKSQRSNPAQRNINCKKCVWKTTPTQPSSRRPPVICKAFLTTPISNIDVYCPEFNIGNPNIFYNHNNYCSFNLQEG